jgi:hypothetical protein
MSYAEVTVLDIDGNVIMSVPLEEAIFFLDQKKASIVRTRPLKIQATVPSDKL